MTVGIYRTHLQRKSGLIAEDLAELELGALADIVAAAKLTDGDPRTLRDSVEAVALLHLIDLSLIAPAGGRGRARLRLFGIVLRQKRFALLGISLLGVGSKAGTIGEA